jgi:hypothetical protein
MMQYLCSSQYALFRGTKVAKHSFYLIGTKTMFGSVSTKFAKHPFYSIGTKMMFGSVSEHFANLWYAKRCKTCVSGLNALFRGTKVVKHPFYNIGSKMIFGSVSENFANLQRVRRCKTCVSGLSACDNPPRKIPYYRLRLIHFGH